MRKSRSTQQVALTIPARDYTSNKDDDATRRSKPWSTRLQIFLLCKIRAKSGAAARAAALCALALLSLAVLFIGRALVTQAWRPERYVVFIDAGSTGTRVNVFSYRPAAGSGEYVDIAMPWPALHQEPGLSSYAGSPQQAAESLAPLLEFARRKVPRRARHRTPIYLLATAGLRLLPESTAADIIDACASVLSSSSSSGFLFTRDWASVLPGHLEGLYGWVAVNYASGALQRAAAAERLSISSSVGSSSSGISSGSGSRDKVDVRDNAEVSGGNEESHDSAAAAALLAEAGAAASHPQHQQHQQWWWRRRQPPPPPRELAGLLEMGGASLQLTFMPMGAVGLAALEQLHPDQLHQLHLPGLRSKKLFTRSYLGLGLDAALASAASLLPTLRQQPRRGRSTDGSGDAIGSSSSSSSSSSVAETRGFIDDPCLPPGYVAGDGRRGSGDFDSCSALAAHLLHSLVEDGGVVTKEATGGSKAGAAAVQAVAGAIRATEQQGHLLELAVAAAGGRGGERHAWLPTLFAASGSRRQRFLAIENFFYVAQALGVPEQGSSLEHLAHRGRQLCARDLAALRQLLGSGQEHYLLRYCFGAALTHVLLGDGLGLPADDGSVVSYVGAVADGRGRRIALSWVLGAAAVELMDGERQQRVMALAVEADMTARRRPAYFGASAAVLLAAAAAAVLVVACGAAAVALFAAAAAEGRWRPQVLGSHCSRASLCVGSGATPVVATAATAAAASTVPPSRQTTQALAQPRPSAQQRSQQPQGDQRLRQSPSELQSVMVRQASAPASPRSKS